ncbi:MAG: cellulase family glycosylhydrolase [Oscillospiraceae bacterium]|nr:cellulase family glycosylhydrolase [Oscillospiraceae bacterium]
MDICLSPMINIQRNPVGGRNFEFYSEDPYLTGYTTGAYVSGMQDNGLSGNLKVIGLNDYETGRSSGGAFATERTIMEVYLRAHEIGLRESGAHTFMTGYNRINSVRCDSNKWMITDVVRGMWGFKGFVMTDWSSDPGVVSLEAQVDMIQSAARTLNTYRTWVNADVAERMPILDRSVKNVLGVLVQTFAFQGAYGVLQPDGTYADGFRIDGRPTVGLTSQDIGQRNLDFGGSDIQKESAVVNKQLADEAIVLLRNDNNVLPLDGDEKVALVSSRLAWKDFFDPRWYGDSASIGDMLLQGTGSAQARFSNSTQDYSMTLVEALNDRGFDVVDWKIDFGALGGNNQAFIDAFENNKPAQGGKKYLYSPECALGTSAEAAAYTAANNLPLATAQANAKAAAEAAAAAADVCVYVITRVAGEDGDLNATTYQVQPKELLVYYEYETAFKNAGKPIIALINVGGTMSTTMIRGGYVSVGTGANNVVRTTTGANAILDVWNPGTAGNEAIADILRGAVNPSGRLAQTFIVNFEDSPSIKMFTDYNNQTDKATFPTYPGNGYNNNAYYADGVYVGHRYFESNPEMYASMVAFPFGYGLSYTTFEFSNLKLDKEIFYKDTDKLSATVTVKNTGTVAGKEVVQLYLSADTWQEEGRPKNELRAYGKTDMLQPGESQTITLSITLNDLQYYDDGTPDSFIGHPETRAFWSASNLPIYGRGKGWTVADDTGFTITIRTNGSDGSLPNQPIDGLKDHFVYSAEKTPPVMLVSASTSAKQFISIVETSKNSRIWVLSFTVTETYSNGEVKVVPYSISLNANNANVDGSYNLGPYTLKYDIKGNASNIKEFSIVNVNNGYFTVGFRLYDGLNSIGYTQYVKSGDSIDWESVEGKYKFFGGKKWEDIEMWVLDAGGKQFTDLNAPITGNIVLTPKFYFVDVTGISMQESARMITGATLELTATITPFNADNKQLTWSSSDEAVATVDQTGIVTAIGDGTVTITVLAANGVVSASCDIIVTEAGAFTVVGKEIIGPDGEPYVMKGINVQGPGAWISRGLTQDLELICDVWKFNSIRLICGTKWNSFASGYNNNETDNMDTIVQKFTDKGIVVMIDNHDYTSIFPRADDTSYVNSEGHTIPSFTEFKAWWVNVANKYKDNPYVWFNIMNEPGGNARNEAGANNWLNYHDQAVEAVRNTGAKNIIVLDDYFWGQANGYQGGSTSWDSAVIRKGPDLNAKYDNLVFSLHVYEQWRDAYGSGIQNGEQRFLAYFNDAWDLGMCVVLGEYGVMRSGSEIANQENAVKNMFNAAIPNNVGRSCYSWFDTALPLTTASSRAGWGIDKLDGTMPTNLTYIGDLVWRDNYDTLSVPIGADPGPGPVGENLIKNADFSNGNTSWNLWGSGTGIQSGAAVPSPIPNNKTFALHIPTGSGLGVNQTGIPLEPGKTYRLTGWGICSTTPSGTNNMDISLQYANGTSGSINTYRTIQFRETVWTQKSVEFTMPAQFSQCEISVYKSSAGFEFWCTDLWLVEVT